MASSPKTTLRVPRGRAAELMRNPEALKAVESFAKTDETSPVGPIETEHIAHKALSDSMPKTPPTTNVEPIDFDMEELGLGKDTDRWEPWTTALRTQTHDLLTRREFELKMKRVKIMRRQIADAALNYVMENDKHWQAVVKQMVKSQ